MIAPVRQRPADRPRTRRDYAWISRIGGRVVGLARLVEAEPQVARIVSFRVDPLWSHTNVPTHLLRSIHRHCRQHGYGRVELERDALPRWMLHLLVRHGFRLAQTEEAESGPAYSLFLQTDRAVGD
jgi:GNAT superfamily N-acetyltransferase